MSSFEEEEPGGASMPARPSSGRSRLGARLARLPALGATTRTPPAPAVGRHDAVELGPVGRDVPPSRATLHELRERIAAIVARAAPALPRANPTASELP